jgi:hypothetical protein
MSCAARSDDARCPSLRRPGFRGASRGIPFFRQHAPRGPDGFPGGAFRALSQSSIHAPIPPHRRSRAPPPRPRPPRRSPTIPIGRPIRGELLAHDRRSLEVWDRAGRSVHRIEDARHPIPTDRNFSGIRPIPRRAGPLRHAPLAEALRTLRRRLAREHHISQHRRRELARAHARRRRADLLRRDRCQHSLHRRGECQA